MARTTDGTLMTPEEAKARLRELGERAPTLAHWLGPSAVGWGLMLGAGLLVACLIRRGGVRQMRPAASFAGTVQAAVVAAAPLLIEGLAKGVLRRAAEPGRPVAPRE